MIYSKDSVSPVKEGEMYFTVVKVVLDVFTEFQLHKKLHFLLSLCVYEHTCSFAYVCKYV